MTYIVNFADPNKVAISVAPKTVDNTTSIAIFGKGAENYGEGLQENILHLLENFASPNPPERKIPGQLWYDTATSKLKLNVSNVWKEVGGKVEIGNALPANAEDGTLFFNTTGTFLGIRVGGKWEEIALTVDLTAHVSDNARHLSASQVSQLADLTGVNSALISDMQAEIGKRVKRAGDTMTDYLTLHAAPQLTMHATTKGYVDGEIYKMSRQLASDGVEYLYSDSFTSFAAPNQTLVTFPFTYAPGESLLWAFVGGIRMASTAFDEASATSIVFSTPMVADTEMTFEKFNTGRLNPPSTKGLVSIQNFEKNITSTGTDVVVPFFVAGKNRVMVWRNGVKARITSDYTEVGNNTIRFTSNLIAGDFVQVSIFTLENGAEIRKETLVAVSNGQQQFTMATPYYLNPNDNLDPLNQDIQVYAEGVFQGKDALVESDGTKIVLADGIPVGTVVEIIVFQLP
jgi:hypothetical protein